MKDKVYQLYIEGWPVVAISRSLGITTSTVRYHLLNRGVENIGQNNLDRNSPGSKESKRETITFAVDQEFKDKLYKKATKQDKSVSKLIRELIDKSL